MSREPRVFWGRVPIFYSAVTDAFPYREVRGTVEGWKEPLPREGYIDYWLEVRLVDGPIYRASWRGDFLDVLVRSQALQAEDALIAKFARAPEPERSAYLLLLELWRRATPLEHRFPERSSVTRETYIRNPYLYMRDFAAVDPASPGTDRTIVRWVSVAAYEPPSSSDLARLRRYDELRGDEKAPRRTLGEINAILEAEGFNEVCGEGVMPAVTKHHQIIRDNKVVKRMIAKGELA